MAVTQFQETLPQTQTLQAISSIKFFESFVFIGLGSIGAQWDSMVLIWTYVDSFGLIGTHLNSDEMCDITPACLTLSAIKHWLSAIELPLEETWHFIRYHIVNSHKSMAAYFSQNMQSS